VPAEHGKKGVWEIHPYHLNPSLTADRGTGKKARKREKRKRVG